MSDNSKNITLMTSAISFSTAGTPRSLKASAAAMKSRIVQSKGSSPAAVSNTEMTRETWRPECGPAKNIPIEILSGGKKTQVEELEEIRVQETRKAWRPVLGPAAP